MPEPQLSQSLQSSRTDGPERKFFANDESVFLPKPDSDALEEMKKDNTELKYGEYVVSTESFMFLRALEPQLGREWILEHLGIESKPILLDKKGDIVEFYCDNTEIVTLPKLPDSLEILDCSNTPLRSLPDLPAGLTELWCYETQITTLPELPAGLRVLGCGGTPLARDPEKIAEVRAKCRERGIISHT